MNPKLFNILKGTNGATYVVNAQGWSNISHSLQFYKARSFKTKVLKAGLQVLLYFKGLFFTNGLKSVTQVQEYLNTMLGTATDFKLDAHSSVLISPTKDKVIVHHHKDYFHKFAFGNSYEKVKKEAGIYALFTATEKYFQTSNFYDLVDVPDNVVSFKLSNSRISTLKEEPNSGNLVLALLEFFKASSAKTCTIAVYATRLQASLQKVQLQSEAQQKVLETIKTNYGTLEFPLGLVHRDFKPWNMIGYQKPLIFDFEEAVTDGPPLEDLLNFYIDPIIRYKTTDEVIKMALSKEHLGTYSSYLKALDIEISLKVFLHFYLIARMLFWSQTPELQTASCYKKLSDSLIAQETYS